MSYILPAGHNPTQDGYTDDDMFRLDRRDGYYTEKEYVGMQEAQSDYEWMLRTEAAMEAQNSAWAERQEEIDRYSGWAA